MEQVAALRQDRGGARLRRFVLHDFRGCAGLHAVPGAAGARRRPARAGPAGSCRRAAPPAVERGRQLGVRAVHVPGGLVLGGRHAAPLRPRGRHQVPLLEELRRRPRPRLHPPGVVRLLAARHRHAWLAGAHGLFRTLAHDRRPARPRHRAAHPGHRRNRNPRHLRHGRQRCVLGRLYPHDARDRGALVGGIARSVVDPPGDAGRVHRPNSVEGHQPRGLRRAADYGEEHPFHGAKVSPGDGGEDRPPVVHEDSGQSQAVGHQHGRAGAGGPQAGRHRLLPGPRRGGAVRRARHPVAAAGGDGGPRPAPGRRHGPRGARENAGEDGQNRGRKRRQDRGRFWRVEGVSRGGASSRRLPD
mmetsp:Transcript_92472/g.283104  ORF Transcript_92472/g.283104 Transcript_92472/m.283104 type:complete len:358 (+) Transcript_92472:2200-3273(+)